MSNNEYIPILEADMWTHRDVIALDSFGIRVIRSSDVPDALILQVKWCQDIVSVRIDNKLLGELHKQSMTA